MKSFWSETYQKLILVPKNISLNTKSLKIGQFLPFLGNQSIFGRPTRNHCSKLKYWFFDISDKLQPIFKIFVSKPIFSYPGDDYIELFDQFIHKLWQNWLPFFCILKKILSCSNKINNFSKLARVGEVPTIFFNIPIP